MMELKKMIKEELEKEANLYASIMAWDEEVDTWEDIAERAYIAGAKAHQTQWHDLREDSNDLPEDTYDVLAQAGYKVHYNFFQNVWVNEKDEVDEHVIAWCEIPKFEEADE